MLVFADLTKAVEENMNNDDVKDLLEEYVDNLALGIANIINILEPESNKHRWKHVTL